MAARGALFAVLGLAATLGFGAQQARTWARAETTVTPSGVDSTGAQDDTSALQALIDGLPDGSTLVFPAGGKYRIEGTLHVKGKNGLTIEGNGSLFFATTIGNRTRSQWSFEGGSNIVVRDVVVKGANPDGGTSLDAYVASLEAQHAFNIWSTNGIELDHVSATDVYGDFVYIGPQAGGLAKNVYVHDSTFARNGRQGIAVTGGDGVRIVHDTISDTRRATFDIEPTNGAGWGAFNVDIEDNTIGPGRLNLLASAGVGPVANVTFAHNTINRGANMYIGDSQGGRRGPFTINDNLATAGWGSAAGSGLLTFVNVDGLTVTGNTMPLQVGRGDYGVKATDSCNVVVSGNTFANAVADSLVTPGPSCATPDSPPPAPAGTVTVTAPSPPSAAPSAASPGSSTTPSTTTAAPPQSPQSPPTVTTATTVRPPTGRRPTPRPATNPKPSRPTAMAHKAALPTTRKSPSKSLTSASTLKHATLVGDPGASQTRPALLFGSAIALAVGGLVGLNRRKLALPSGATTARYPVRRAPAAVGAITVLPRHGAHRAR